MVRLPRNEKQTYRLNSRAQMWPSGLTLAMTLTLNFQGQIQNLLYLRQKWSDCHETKSKHIDWTLGLKCDHRVWLWPWPWPWIFKVKYRICYISAKNGQIASKRKANISIELQASNVTNGFELDHNIDLWILKVKCDLDLWPHRWPWPWIFMVKFWNICISEWEGWLTLHKGGGSRSFMTIIMTIWWPRSGVWIYQVVTGVTSVVGVPSTHLVSTDLLCLQQGEGVPEQKKGSYMYFHLDSYFHWFAMFAARRGSARTKERVLHVFPSWQLFPLICYVCSKERECQNKRKGPTCISILTVISTDLLCLQQGEGVPEQKKGSYMYFHLDSYFHWFAMFAARRGSARTKERVLCQPCPWCQRFLQGT